MRLQPPKDGKKYLKEPSSGKKMEEYIGNHRVLFCDGDECSFNDFLDSNKEFSSKDTENLLTLFPWELHGLAENFLKSYFKEKENLCQKSR